MGKCFLEKAEKCMQSKIIFKDIKRRKGLGWGRENWGEEKGNHLEGKTRFGMMFGLVLIYVNCKNKSMKAVLGMDIPFVT